jgi:hypothetical protein
MRLPGFGAEMALSNTHGNYRVQVQMINGSLGVAHLHYAVASQSGETINIKGCGANEIRLGEGENVTCLRPSTFWSEQPPIYVPPPPPGGGGGGGGGAQPEMTPLDIACARANKDCRPGLPSTYPLCMTIRCQKDYCDNNPCSDADKQKSRDAKALYEYEECASVPKCEKPKK